jgi:hypothetical protein
MHPTFRYVEDYLEFIAGYRDINGTLRTTVDTARVNLARYDVNFINGIAVQTINNKAMTDRQGRLAIQLIYKYERQLKKLDPPVSVPLDLNEFRLGERIVDRTKRLWLEVDYMVLKFPFDTNLITEVRRQAKEGHGNCKFDRETKEWRLSLTEDMVNWAVTIAASNDIHVDEPVLALFEQIVAIEQKPFAIQLTEQDGTLSITNAPASLIDYINTQLGGFSQSNLLTLVDHGPVLGYTISDDLRSRALQGLPPFTQCLVSNRTTRLTKTGVTLADVLHYARLSNRLPIYVHDTGIQGCKDTHEVRFLTRHASSDIRPRLMVSFSEFVIGAKKKCWLSNAEKVVVVDNDTIKNTFDSSV